MLDWFVEDAVDQADAELLDDMVGKATHGEGLVVVAPASGVRECEYIEKLGRLWIGKPMPEQPGKLEQLTDRACRLVDQLEDRFVPDVTIVDPRAGLSDVASAALVGLGAQNLLFALDTPQTWAGYRHLFEHWHRDRTAWGELRTRLQFVMGMTPELNRKDYAASFKRQAYDLLAQYVYDDLGAGELDGWHPQLDEQGAPHDAPEIGWSLAFQAWSPLTAPPTPDQVAASYGGFLRRTRDCIGLPQW